MRKRQDICRVAVKGQTAMLDPSTVPAAPEPPDDLQAPPVAADDPMQTLRATNAELEAAVQRQLQRYDCVPVGLCTIDSATTLLELNATAAGLLGSTCDALLGQPLHSRLSAQGGLSLRAMLTRAGAASTGAADLLGLSPSGPDTRKLLARLSLDPTEGHYLVALLAP